MRPEPYVILHDARIRRFVTDVERHEVRIEFAHLPVMIGDDERCEHWSYAGEMVLSDVTASKIDLLSAEGWVVTSTIEDENGVEIDEEDSLRQEQAVKKVALGFADGSSVIVHAGRAVIHVGAPIEFIQIETWPGDQTAPTASST